MSVQPVRTQTGPHKFRGPTLFKSIFSASGHIACITVHRRLLWNKKYSSVQTATNRIEINTVGLIFCKDTHRKPSLNSGKLQIKKVRVRVSTFVSNNMGPAFVDGSDIRNKGNY